MSNGNCLCYGEGHKTYIQLCEYRGLTWQTDYDDLANTLRAVAHPVPACKSWICCGRARFACATSRRRSRNVRRMCRSRLMVLRDAGLVEYRKDGLQVFYRLSDPSVPACWILSAGRPATKGWRFCPTAGVRAATPCRPNQYERGGNHVKDQSSGRRMPELQKTGSGNAGGWMPRPSPTNCPKSPTTTKSPLMAC